MEIKELKNKITLKRVPSSLLIFVNSEHSFLASQYVHFIAEQRNLEVRVIEDLSEHSNTTRDLFSSEEISVYLDVLYCDKFSETDTRLLSTENLIIITDKLEDKVASFYGNLVIYVPKLEEWQIKDYIYSMAEGVEESDLDWLISLCKNDIYRLNLEIQKISIFEEIQRKFLFKDFIRDGIFSDLSQYTIFNITNAIQSKDIEALKVILPEIKNIDVEAVGIATILYNNFKKMIQVWFQADPTPENTGLKSNQIWAIKKLPRNYSKEQLMRIFELITSIDAKYKTGELPVDLIVDYLIIKILSI